MKSIQYNIPSMKKKQIYDNSVYDISMHFVYIQNIYQDIPFIEKKNIEAEIKKKFYSYKSQDKKKKRYDEEKHITYKELIYKLYYSELKCYYCKTELCLASEKRNTKYHWSLERFNNNLGHYDNNTCISCIECNLKRRNENHEYFKNSKNQVISKKDNISTLNTIHEDDDIKNNKLIVFNK